MAILGYDALRVSNRYFESDRHILQWLNTTVLHDVNSISRSERDDRDESRFTEPVHESKQKWQISREQGTRLPSHVRAHAFDNVHEPEGSTARFIASDLFMSVQEHVESKFKRDEDPSKIYSSTDLNRHRHAYDAHHESVSHETAPLQSITRPCESWPNVTHDRSSQDIESYRQTPSKKYARRKRHKPKLDRYEFKGGARGKRSITNRNSGSRKRRKMTGLRLHQEFDAPNIDPGRLTLWPSSQRGLLSKGKTSILAEHRDLPDLTFSNMTFLSQPERPAYRDTAQHIDMGSKQPKPEDGAQRVTSDFPIGDGTDLCAMGKFIFDHAQYEKLRSGVGPQHDRISSLTILEPRNGVKSQQLLDDDACGPGVEKEMSLLSYEGSMQCTAISDKSQPSLSIRKSQCSYSPSVLLTSLTGEGLDVEGKSAASTVDPRSWQEYTRKALIRDQPGSWRASNPIHGDDSIWTVDDLRALADRIDGGNHVNTVSVFKQQARAIEKNIDTESLDDLRNMARTMNSNEVQPSHVGLHSWNGFYQHGHSSDTQPSSHLYDTFMDSTQDFRKQPPRVPERGHCPKPSSIQPDLRPSIGTSASRYRGGVTQDLYSTRHLSESGLDHSEDFISSLCCGKQVHDDGKPGSVAAERQSMSMVASASVSTASGRPAPGMAKQQNPVASAHTGQDSRSFYDYSCQHRPSDIGIHLLESVHSAALSEQSFKGFSRPYLLY